MNKIGVTPLIAAAAKNEPEIMQILISAGANVKAMAPHGTALMAAVVGRNMDGARLLNAVLADLYGEGRLLAEGLLPPAIIHGHHNYLWQCRGLEPAGGAFLNLYGCDLARSPDGRWWVIADRTQGPSGAGYAVQNRLIVTPMYGRLFRSLGVQRLAGFFRTLQQRLAALAPTDGEPPVIAPGAAISNAVANALGVRVPILPMTPQRVLGALSKGGKA